MNILFIYSLNYRCLPIDRGDVGGIHFGISYISAFLKKHGHNTKLFILSSFLGRKNKILIDDYLKKFYPKLICFTAVTTQYPFIASIASYIRSHYPGIYLLVGGPHVSLNPERIFFDGFNALCIGEGEYPTLELVSQLERRTVPSSIPNLWIRQGEDIEKNPTRPFLHDLDNLPFADRTIWQKWIPQVGSVVLLGRGCPFQCTYCSNHALKKLASGNYVRLRSTGNILEEIKMITDRFEATKDIYLEIETIAINKEWAIELCGKLEMLNLNLKQPLSFGVNLRITPNADSESIFAAFKKSNFKFVNIGLESGSEKVRYKILKRFYSNQDVINTVKLARKYGLGVNFYNLIGVPGETTADFKETVKINQMCLPDYCNNSIFYPYQGTELYLECKKQGLLKESMETVMERKIAVLDPPGFSKKQIQKSYIWFEYYVFKGRKPLYKILLNALDLKLRTKSNALCFYLQRYLFSFKLQMKKLVEKNKMLVYLISSNGLTREF